MAFRVRSSKYRHVFGSVGKKDQCYEGVKITKNAHDSSFCAVNPKFIAIVIESAGGGAFIVLPIEKTGRVDINTPKVCGHKGPVLDIKWNPFNDCVIASCSDDATIKLWQIPENGLKSNLTEWLMDLHGHQRRVGYMQWHPTAENILLSAGYDFKCILWNTETAEPINIISCHTDTIFSISWNRDGSLFATTSKDKKIRVIDPREGTVVAEGPGHQGPKASKVVFIGDKNRLFTTGFSRMSERQFGVWNIKDLSKPLKLDVIDSSSGVLFPVYDPDTGVAFVAGKGDGNIRYYEIVDDAPYCHFLNAFQSSFPQRGLGFMPKRGIDPHKCEIFRFYKLHAMKGICESVSMIVPRKSEMFQEDIFPPTASACPSLTSDEWISGQNREPILVSLKDGALANAPTITTYKAVKRGVSSTSPDVQSNRRSHSTSVSSSVSSPPTSPNPAKTPASVKNIKKLSTSDDTTNNNEDGDSVEDRIAALEQREQNSITSQRTTMLTNSNKEMSVDKRTFSQTLGAGDLNSLPKTDPESVSSPDPYTPTMHQSSSTSPTSVPPTSLPLRTPSMEQQQLNSPQEGSLPPSPGSPSPQPKDKVRIVETTSLPGSSPSSPRSVAAELQTGSGNTYAPDGTPEAADDTQFNIRPSVVRRSKRWIRNKESGSDGKPIENGGTPTMVLSNGVENGSAIGNRFDFGRSSLRSSLRGRKFLDQEKEASQSPPLERKDMDMDTDDKIHVKKVWSPPPQMGPRIPMENGVPNTDPELHKSHYSCNGCPGPGGPSIKLRKAYFRQLEEIKSLKEQISLKDHRIRQLEEELRQARETGGGDAGEFMGESNC